MHITYYDTRVYRMGEMCKIVYMKTGINDLTFWDKEDKKIAVLEDDEKRRNNIIRAKNRVLELLLCNEWDWFCTFTLDKQKYDRYNLDGFRKDFTQWIRNQRRLTGRRIEYVLVAEQHRDGAWHLHGVFRNYDNSMLSRFSSGIHPLNLVRGGYLFDKRLQDKFGFNSFAVIKDKTKTAFYLTKYITKQLADGIKLGNHIYFSSKGLKGKELIGEGATCWTMGNVFFNDYNGVEWCPVEKVDDFIKTLR